MNYTASSSEMLPRILYVGNLDSSVNEELITTLFNNLRMGNIVLNCKMIYEQGSDPYCFVELIDHQAASHAISVMNKRMLLGKEMKVNWATSPGHAVKQDTSQHHHIFVGDLSPEIETELLRDAFSPFGEISDCRVVRDPQTNKPKGYGFITFVKKGDAENAIATMNGQWLGSRAIRTNWATRKPQSHPKPEAPEKTQTYEEVYNLASATNSTVYCSGVNGLTEENIRSIFEPYGAVKEMRIFKDKGYSFIKFERKEDATNAIVNLNNTEVSGRMLKCKWGKELKESSNAQFSSSPAAQASAATDPSTTAGQVNYPYPGYWYPAAYSVPNQYVPQQYGQYNIVPLSWPPTSMPPTSQYPPNYGYRMP